MSIKKIKNKRKKRAKFFKKFVYSNFFFNINKKEKITLEIIGRFLSLWKNIPKKIERDVIVNNRWRFTRIKSWNFLDDAEAILWERMNTIWRFTILTFKQRYRDYHEDKEYQDILKEQMHEVSSFTATLARKKGFFLVPAWLPSPVG